MMIRAPFLSSIISPMLAGTLAGVYVTGTFNWLNFLLVFTSGVCLHIAVNVYNDIYDTLQGTDKINVHRNEFSGGSGVLLDFPDSMPTMYRIARSALVLALLATLLLVFRVDPRQRVAISSLYLLAAFFSKFYTAAPLKLAYRGLGEISVWFAFGPMAILIAAAAQNAWLQPAVTAVMPITGISTLSILLIGQMIDLDADKATGKWGIAARSGNKVTAFTYIAVQILLCINVLLLGFFIFDHGWLLIACLLPYALILPKTGRMLIKGYDDPETLKAAAGLNVQLHLMFSVLFFLMLLLIVILH